MAENHIFRVIFVQDDNVYEIYAKHVSESDMFGFVVMEGLLFGEKSALVVDPTEERLRMQFGGVKRTYIPMQSVLRIDEVEKQGTAKITSMSKKGSNISQFPPADR